MIRNAMVEYTVDAICERIDAFIAGQRLTAIPDASATAIIDKQLGHRSSSVRIASLFFMFYSIVDASWNCNSIPTGIRGEYGDKKLSTILGLRSITLHNAITAFGENLGWKGNISNSKLQNDGKFSDFVHLISLLNLEGRQICAEYMAMRFVQSRRLISPLPPVANNILTYGRARELFFSLIATPSGGNIQQFLIAALLLVHRRRYGYDIRTHHVHASDQYDTTAGDIEELYNGDLLRAYEVTVRPDWKNRVGDFRKKMDNANLRKYTIIASNVNSDYELSVPANMIRFLAPYDRDIAVVDIHDFANVFAMELSANELNDVVAQTYNFLTTPKLCGRADIIERFSGIVADWLHQ